MKFILLTIIVCATIGIYGNCENSSFSLIEVAKTDKGVEIYTQLTIGAGTNGNIKGAENGTGSFTFAFYSEHHSVLSEFAPKRLEGKSTACMNSGVLHNAGFNGASQMLTYSSNDCKFTCVNSEARCGPMQLEVYTIKFIFDEVPDSIRVFGIEGNGNPFAGCYNSPNMVLDFADPKLEFKGFRKINRNSSVELIWSVNSKALTKEFEIVRKDENGVSSIINTVIPQFNSGNELIYSYLDTDLIPGKYTYTIKHKDWFDGEELSKQIIATIEANSMMISLNQNSGWIEVALKQKKPDSIQLFNFDLEEIEQDMRIYKGVLKIKNDGLIPGIYHLKTEFKDDYSLTKLVVL